jgi:hypothetical protein
MEGRDFLYTISNLSLPFHGVNIRYLHISETHHALSEPGLIGPLVTTPFSGYTYISNFNPGSDNAWCVSDICKELILDIYIYLKHTMHCQNRD